MLFLCQLLLDFQWTEVIFQLRSLSFIINTVGGLKINIKKFLGNSVSIKIDRPLGSRHPQWDFIYPVNYGFVPDTIAADGEEIDAYLLGVFEPIDEYTGICTAIIHRTNDNDDKLIIVPAYKNYSTEQIIALTEFQERFFKFAIIKNDDADL